MKKMKPVAGALKGVAVLRLVSVAEVSLLRRKTEK